MSNRDLAEYLEKYFANIPFLFHLRAKKNEKIRSSEKIGKIFPKELQVACRFLKEFPTKCPRKNKKINVIFW